ncbi:dnaJ homolog subfamily C member 24 isoform X1 [Eublepharis macularius]|uniref:DnaJ homolog subfamily C member 24 n=1 Tax=Eublepharis macularius TaxID=481883 RepID=A0AA97IXG1_EUBMA|nr:dnaJ homolog subfamily C member 24 isoform X1 [Eublepharis macularius]
MAFEELPKEDWYNVLNAEPSDSLAELKRKYQKLVLLYHPDKQNADVPAGEVEARKQRFIEIDRAWKILGNEETKKEYDLQRREHELTEVLPVDAQVSFQDMAWNCNNQCYSLICRCGGNYTISKNEAEDVSLVCCDTCSLVIEILR